MVCACTAWLLGKQDRVDAGAVAEATVWRCTGGSRQELGCTGCPDLVPGWREEAGNRWILLSVCTRCKTLLSTTGHLRGVCQGNDAECLKILQWTFVVFS